MKNFINWDSRSYLYVIMLSVRFEMLHNTDKFERSRKREKKKGVNKNEVFFVVVLLFSVSN